MNELTNKKRIGIISIEPQMFKNDKTGEVNEMLKITYLVKVAKDNERFYGNNLLVSYVRKDDKQLEKLIPLIIKPNAQAEIDEQVVENRIKWRMNSINDINFR